MSRRKRCPGHMERRGRGYRWRVCVGGKYSRFTIRAASLPEAEAWARRRFEELTREHARHDDGLTVGVTMADLLDAFERDALPLLARGTQAAYQDSLKPIRAYFTSPLLSDAKGNPLPVARIRKAHVSAYLAWRRTHRRNGDAPLHNRTLVKDRAVLHRLFAFAEDEHEWREGNPVSGKRRLPVATRQPVILSNAQYDALLAACRDDMVRAYVLFCGETGARSKSEALWLRWEDVDFAGGFVHIVSGRDGHDTKGKRSRYTPMTPRLTAALRDHFARYRFTVYDRVRRAYVFHHTRTGRRHVAGERVQDFKAAVKGARNRANVALRLARVPLIRTEPRLGWVTHDLRHRRCTSWLAEGHSPAKVKEAMGHADLATTMGYMHLVKEHLRDLVADGQKLDIAAQQ